MLITHYEHACVLVEIDGARVLFDPGAYSQGFEELDDLDLILITHEHPDHLDLGRLPALLGRNPGATLVASPAVAASLPEDAPVQTIEPGTSVVVAGITVEAVGENHAVIHPLVPNVANTGFVLNDLVWHPGDSLDTPARPIDVLLLPVGGPWMKLQEAIDAERAIAPRIAIPIHQAGLSALHQKLHYQLLTNLAPAGTTFHPLSLGVAEEF